MTNKEKAIKIAEKNLRSHGFGYDSDSSIECYQSAIEAMKWKDEQFKTKINDLFNMLEKENYNDRVKSGFEIFKDKLIKMMEDLK